ncbi:MAG: hypothetical protein ACPGWR_05965 [Ardenticatenaceae bacterium]
MSVVLVWLMISACGVDEAPTAPSPPTRTPFIIASATPMPISTPTAIPTPTSTPTHIAVPDLRLGVINRGMNCPFISEVIEVALEQKSGVIVERVWYDTPEELFAALASIEEEREIDLTLCVIYPDDMDYFAMYPDHTRLIGDDFVPSTDYQELLIINAAFESSLKNMTCAYNLLKKMNFPEKNMQDMEAEWSARRDPDELLSGVNCAS